MTAAANKPDCDIAIVGGGPVGLLLYCLLRPLPYRIRLIEKRPQLIDEGDLRSYILNRTLIDKLCDDGAIDLPGSSRLKLNTLIVSSAGTPVKFRLSSPTPDAPLKYVISALALQRALVAGLDDRAPLMTGASLSAVASHPDCLELSIESADGPSTMRSRALVIADGARSRTAAMLGIAEKRITARHSALVLNLSANRPIPNQAEQCLTAQGPISIVPGAGGRMVGIIVSSSHDYLAGLAEPAAVNRLLERTFRGRYGLLEQVGKPALFPIQPLRRPCRAGRALLLGDACCALSPVAAQGLSLGMDSARQLSQALKRQPIDLANSVAWDDFASAWEQEHAKRYRLKQDLNQMYARAIMNLGPAARMSMAPAMALLGLSPQLRRRLVAMLSE